jgi:hypothetical protein
MKVPYLGLSKEIDIGGVKRISSLHTPRRESSTLCGHLPRDTFIRSLTPVGNRYLYRHVFSSPIHTLCGDDRNSYLYKYHHTPKNGVFWRNANKNTDIKPFSDLHIAYNAIYGYSNTK